MSASPHPCHPSAGPPTEGPHAPMASFRSRDTQAFRASAGPRIAALIEARGATKTGRSEGELDPVLGCVVTALLMWGRASALQIGARKQA